MGLAQDQLTRLRASLKKRQLEGLRGHQLLKPQEQPRKHHHHL